MRGREGGKAAGCSSAPLSQLMSESSGRQPVRRMPRSNESLDGKKSGGGRQRVYGLSDWTRKAAMTPTSPRPSMASTPNSQKVDRMMVGSPSE